MNALTVILSIWTVIAICAILFVRGATPRVERPVKAQKARAARLSVAE
jgi:hypothetical protein